MVDLEVQGRSRGTAFSVLLQGGVGSVLGETIRVRLSKYL